MTRYIIFYLVALTMVLSQPSLSFSQEKYYYPPVSGDEWETISPADLRWNEEELENLYTFLEEKNTRGFIVLHKGKIVIEKYFGLFNKDLQWYWASAGKTLTAFLTGLAQEQGYLDIHQPTSVYLGQGWTSCTPELEEKITIWHQLTMTTGLETTDVIWDCTDPECLLYRVDAGGRWFYHNAPYTMISSVIEQATGKDYNEFIHEQIEEKIGMDGEWKQKEYNRVYWSTARDMARYGLLILSGGDWNGETIMNDKSYLNQMISQSQDLNPSYGYLWWLNGQDAFKQPGLDIVFNGSIVPGAPDDMFAGLGKNDQKLYVVPSKDLVVVRMGNAADEDMFALSGFDDELWQYLTKVMKSAEDKEYTLRHQDVDRTFTVHLPPGYSQENSMPLVILLHGGSGDPEAMISTSEFNNVADSVGCIAVYPKGGAEKGDGFSWADGRGTNADLAGIDDVGFIGRLIDFMHDNFNTHPDSVYVTGISNGGFMSQRIACELSHKISAVATVTATIDTSFMSSCNPSKPVPVMFFNGTSDPFVPYEGGEMSTTVGTIVSTDDIMDFWKNVNNCLTKKNMVEIPDADEDDNCTVEKYIFSDCDCHADVILFKILNGGHTWPGVELPLYELIAGNTNEDIHASREMWYFFEQYGKCEITSVVTDKNFPLSVYPNPPDNKIYVKTSRVITSIEVIDIFGETLLASENQKDINITSLKKGLYLLRISTEGRDDIIRKFVK